MPRLSPSILESKVVETPTLTLVRVSTRVLTQVRMAERLGVGQDNISRLEGRADMLLSTLRSYVQAMGGSLDLIARFPDRPDVTLSGPLSHDTPDDATAQENKDTTSEQHRH